MKKIINFCLAIFILICWSCQKEISWDNFNNATGPATFTLQGSSGTCIISNVFGIYAQGINLTASNKIDITVNVTTPGTYQVSTGTVNGISFSGSGTFAATGTQTITLKGSGTPASAGSFSVPVSTGNSSCSIPINVVSSSSVAAGNLGGAPGSCTSTIIAGNYILGTALTSGNTAQIQVNVTSPGAYSISTNTVNGMSFSKTGTFTSTGMQNVTLTGTGTPSASGNITFSLSFGSSSCTFQIPVSAAAATSTTGTYFWKFISGGVTYQGTVDTLNSDLSSIPGGFTNFTFNGESATGDTSILVSVIDISGGIQPNEIYTTSSTTSNSAAFLVDQQSGGILFQAEQSMPSVTMTIKITALNTTTKVVDGTFSGLAKDSNGTVKTISNGQFKVKYR